MAKFLRVEMPDGSEWEVPASVIAASYADYIAQCVDEDGGNNNNPEDSRQIAFNEAMGDNDTLIDWAKSDMNWSDVASVAMRIKNPDAPDYEDGWVNGESSVVEHAPLPFQSS